MPDRDEAKGTVRAFRLDEAVCFGGEWMTAGRMIQELRATLPDERAVDRYLQGFFYVPPARGGVT